MTQCANDPGCFVLFVRSTGFSRHFRLKAPRPILWTGGGGSRRPELLVDYALNWLQNQIQNRNMIPIGKNWREHRCTMRGSAGASPSRWTFELSTPRLAWQALFRRRECPFVGMEFRSAHRRMSFWPLRLLARERPNRRQVHTIRDIAN